ncbi:serine aminopeptidase domain-containing protein [Cupriavidus campinensis]|uniref:serine aminopeptidase domain-containing protein n=1 Tax=Cupriavidus campinensis TaxID=151783 RepID=UPI001BAA139B|nr:alpha/beta hydrolase [Cupriavidus campinensis]
MRASEDGGAMGGAGGGPHQDGHGDGHGAQGPHGPGMVHAVMEPLLFDGCYGWLHRPIVPLSPLLPDACGVVLCNPFGQEAIMTHRGWRYLATVLSANGMPALRFDYHGTGDSDGDESDPARLQAWTASIVAAVRVLRERTGVTRVALCGIRLGALLAVLATQEMEAEAIDALVLLAPVVRGRDHLRELRALQSTARSSPADQLDPAETEDFMTVVGNRFYRDTIEAIQACDLGKPGQLRQRPAARMLILSASTLDGAGRLAERAAALGCDVTQAPFDEYETYVSYPELNDLPWQAFRHATAWLAGVPETDVREPDNARVRRLATDDAPVLHGDRFVERRAHYGADGLFGILCEPPAAARGDGAPVVLIINTGAGHHVGDARMGVLCARYLARRGIASMRMDLGGIGDSVSLALPRYAFQPYGSHLRRDVTAAAAWLAAQGFGRVVLFGICSGAFVGLHAATGSEHVAGAVLVNVQKFLWPEGLGIQDVVQQRPSPRQAATRVYLTAALDTQKWVRVFKGDAEIGSIAWELGRRIMARVRTRAQTLAAWITRADTPVRQVHGLIRRLDERSVPVWLVFGGYDPGLGELATHFGARGRQLRRYRHVKCVISDEVDHALRSYAAREAVYALLDQYLRTHFCEDADTIAALVAGIDPEPALR